MQWVVEHKICNLAVSYWPVLYTMQVYWKIAVKIVRKCIDHKLRQEISLSRIHTNTDSTNSRSLSVSLSMMWS